MKICIGLAVGLAAIAKLRQQLAHRVRADRVPLRPQGGSELLMALGDPPQRPHRVAQRDRFDQLAQILQQGGIRWRSAGSTAAVTPHSATGQRGVVEILQPSPNRATRHSSGPRHRRQTAVADGTHFRRGIQASSPLIQALSSLSAELVAQRHISFLNGSFVDHRRYIARPAGRNQRRLSRGGPDLTWRARISNLTIR